MWIEKSRQVEGHENPVTVVTCDDFQCLFSDSIPETVIDENKLDLFIGYISIFYGRFPESVDDCMSMITDGHSKIYLQDFVTAIFPFFLGYCLIDENEVYGGSPLLEW